MSTHNASLPTVFLLSRFANIGLLAALAAPLGGCFLLPSSSSSSDPSPSAGPDASAPTPPGPSQPGTPSSGWPGTTPDAAAADPCEKGGPISASETWSVDSCPNGIHVTSPVEVVGPAELTITPGTKMTFESGVYLRAQPGGAILAKGAADKKILFTGWQASPGAWGGISFHSNNVKNEISNAIVEYAGGGGQYAAVRLVADGSQVGTTAMTDVEIRNGDHFGLYVEPGAHITPFERVSIHDNHDGAAWVKAAAVPVLKGTGNVFANNGTDNVVRVETRYGDRLSDDVLWPNLTPAVYRLVGQDGQGGEAFIFTGHLTIEAATVLEMAGGSGLLMEGGTSGLKAQGTADKPIVFRGIGGSSWYGLTFGASTWSENRLENVRIENAAKAPEDYPINLPYNGPKAGILVDGSTSILNVSNLTVTGANAAPGDIDVDKNATLNLTGTNTGHAGGALAITRY